jgi:hypothetical protein
MMRRIRCAMLCVVVLIMTACWMEGMIMGGLQLAAQEKAEPRTDSSGTGDPKPHKDTAPGFADIAPIFSKYLCTVCHGGADPRAGLSLDDYKSMMKGGKSGKVIIPGDPGKSELLLRLKGLSEPRMPFDGPPWVSDAEINTIERWILAGAKQ